MYLYLNIQDEVDGFKIHSSKRNRWDGALFIINYTAAGKRTKDIVSGHDYPHITMIIKNNQFKEKGKYVRIDCEEFHLSEDSSGKIFKQITTVNASSHDPQGGIAVIADPNKDSANIVSQDATTILENFEKFLKASLVPPANIINGRSFAIF